MLSTCLLVLGLLAGAGDDKAPAAMVLSASNASVIHPGETKLRSVSSMTLVLPGDQLQTKPTGEVLLVFFGDGHRERIKAETRVTVQTTGCTPATGVDIVPGASMSAKQLVSFRGLSPSARAGVLVFRAMIPTKTYRVQPIKWAAVPSTRPTLTWEPDPKSQKYQVQLFVYRFGEEKPEVLWQQDTSLPRLEYPSTEKPLVREETYRWKVVPVRDGKTAEPIVESHFSVLSADRLQALTDLEHLQKSDKAEDLFLIARLFESSHVFDQALPMFERLQKLLPDHVDVLRSLAYLYTQAGRQEEASLVDARIRKLAKPSSK